MLVLKKKLIYKMTISGLFSSFLKDMWYIYLICIVLCLHWSIIQAEAKILKGPHEDLENYLEAIDKLRSNIQFFGSKKGFKSSDGIVVHANNLLAKAISKLEDEFRQLLLSYRYIFLFLMFIFWLVWWKIYLHTWTQ